VKTKWPLLVLLLLAACRTTFTLSLTAEEIQQKLDAKLPASKRKMHITATVEKVQVVLKEGADRIGARTTVRFDIPLAGEVRGNAAVNGRVRYVPDEGAFYLDSPELSELDVAHIPESLRGPVQDVMGAAMQAYFAVAPVYRLKQSDFKQSLARLTLREVTVQSGKLLLTIGVP
jgi:hypothetical protein